MGLFSKKTPRGLQEDRYPGPPGKPDPTDLIEGTRPCIRCFSYFRPNSSADRFCCADCAEKAAQV